MKNMKKVLIAAGIAAATVASFGANAITWTNTSHASINTTVTGDTYLAVVATGKTISLTQLNSKNTELGKFAVTLAGGSTDGYDSVTLDDIHAHGYPSGFKVQFKGGMTDCEVELGTHDGVTVNEATGDTYNVNGTCGFTTGDAASIQLNTVASNPTVNDAGVKTITARFRAFKA